MLPRKFFIALLLACAFVFAALSPARAWPDMPPAKAFISGPGIEGQVQIYDENVLRVLRLGSFEDLARGAVQTLKDAGEGFKIIRYFEGGEFRFGDLTYYPNAAGARSVVYFDDALGGKDGPSPLHQKWFYTTTNGDRVLQKYLLQLGVPLPSGQIETKSDTGIARVDALPEKIVVNQAVTLGFTLAQNYKVAPVQVSREGDSHRTILAAEASGNAGHYVFTYAFPKAGVWNWSVRASYNDPEISMPALDVMDSNTSSAPVSAQEVSPAQETTQTENAAAKFAVEPLTFALALFAAGIGIVGIAAVLQLQNRRR